MGRVRQARRPGKRQRFTTEHISYNTQRQRQSKHRHAHYRGLDLVRYQCRRCGWHTWEIWTGVKATLRTNQGVPCGDGCTWFADLTNVVWEIAVPRPRQSGGLGVIADDVLDRMLESMLIGQPSGLSWHARRPERMYVLDRSGISGWKYLYIPLEAAANV